MAANTSQPMNDPVVPDEPVPHDIETVFRQKGIPLTRQRAIIWEFFAGADRAATIAEATAALRDQHVAQATVYRAVTLLTELGLLCRVQSREGELVLHGAAHRPQPPADLRRLPPGGALRGRRRPAELEERLTAETGFSIYGHHLEVYGVCADCRAGGDGLMVAKRGGTDGLAGLEVSPAGGSSARGAAARTLPRPAARGGGRRQAGGPALHGARGRPAQPRPRPAAGAAGAAGRGARPATRHAGDHLGRLRRDLHRRPARAAGGGPGRRRVRRHRPRAAPRVGRARLRGRRHVVPPAAVARAPPAADRGAARGRRARPPSSPSMPSASSERFLGRELTRRPGLPSSRPSASTPAAKRASTTRSSPRRRCSPRRCRCTGTATNADGHWLLDYTSRPCAA